MDNKNPKGCDCAASLDKEILIMQKDVEALKEDVHEIKKSLQMLTKALCDPDSGALARTNANTRFRQWSEKLIWLIVATVVAMAVKLFRG